MNSAMILILMASILRLSVPIILMGFGNMFSERAGIQNLGAEGMMIGGAFGAVLGAYLFKNAWIGVLCGMLCGMLAASLHSLISVEFGGVQNISGLGLNMLAAGLVSFLCRELFGSGLTPTVVNLQTTEFLRDVPGIGSFLAQFSPLAYLTIFLVAGSAFLFNRTVFGTHVISVGDDPRAAETAGINVWSIRHLCVSVFCGALAGLAGAYLSIGQLSFYMEDMTNSKGMLAVIAVKMGRWEPKRIVGVALIFGLFDAVQTQLQINNPWDIAPELIQMLPFVAGIVTLLLSASSDANPKALRLPYLKNKYKF